MSGAEIERGRPGIATATARAAVLLLAAACATDAVAQDYPAATTVRRPLFDPSLSVELTWTNNVRLNDDERQSDFAIAVRPRVGIDYAADRLRVNGSVALPFVVHTAKGTSDNLQPEISLRGRLEIVDQFFFLEAAARVYTQYFDPFGPRSEGIENIIVNRYTAQQYSISPSIEGRLGSSVRYRLRDDNIWSELGDSPVNVRSGYSNRLTGLIERDPTPFGWGADLLYTTFEYGSSIVSDQTLALLRGRASWQLDPQVRLIASAGYERNDLAFTRADGSIYGVGVNWRPTDRTLVDANWEHRFFGASYRVQLNHRTAFTRFALRASRDATSYPDQLATIPAEAFVPDILNDVFVSRIPDDAARAQFVEEFMRARGLSEFLTSPVAIYSQQIQIVESARASFGIVGIRNSILFSAYYQKTEPAGDLVVSVDPRFSEFNNNRQTGASASWSHLLGPLTSLTFVLDGTRTEALPPLTGETDRWSARFHVARRISPKTSGFAGARYQHFTSDFHRGYTETAVFVGATHSFR